MFVQKGECCKCWWYKYSGSWRWLPKCVPKDSEAVLYLDLFLWIEDKTQEFHPCNRYWILIWLLSAWKKVRSGPFHCPHQNCCQSMGRKVQHLFYILPIGTVEETSLMYFLLTGMRPLIKPSNAFEGNTVHLLLGPQDGQKQITENTFSPAYFLSTSS